MNKIYGKTTKNLSLMPSNPPKKKEWDVKAYFSSKQTDTQILKITDNE